MSGQHEQQTDNSIHTPFRWTWADATARGSETDIESHDTYKVGLQIDDYSIWMLEDLTPTWIQVGNAPIDIEFTIAAEDSNVINVALQIQRSGVDMAESHVLHAWLSDSLAPPDMTATPPNGNIAIGTDGVIMTEFITDLYFLLYFDSDGQADIDIGDSGTPTFYLNVLLPDGTITPSGAITFA